VPLSSLYYLDVYGGNTVVRTLDSYRVQILLLLFRPKSYVDYIILVKS